MKKAAGLILAVLLTFYFSCVHYTEAYQVGIVWDRFSGELSLDDTAGFTVSSPWVFVSKIDLRPARVCITSTARTYNCKLVRFSPEAYREFVEIQGFRYYWWANRISFNSGYEDEYRGMKDILRGYAFSEKKFPFLIVVREYEEGKTL